MRDIAVVGMAGRFPGGLDNLDLLVEALRARTVTAGPVAPDRWDAARYYASDESAKGKAYVDRANFITQDVRAMDAGFFDLPARVAENIDPQQRLLLELIWEAFENAGLDLPAHAGRKVGVYVGGFMLDHMVTLMQVSNRTRHNANTAAGMMMTMLANRLSHAFDLRGPSLSIDTACSSSLVAFSYACRDIWAGDCEMAVVGGANVMTRPEYPIGMSKGQFLSRDGQCKSFDARGDGYGRAEGGGIVLLKPLDRALADGDTILATVAGAGVNSDGRTPGISMPSEEAQRALIREVSERFSIDTRNVRYVECHGTGTAVGDPIEAAAIGSVYGAGRHGDERVVLGSIKSNIGHMEAGAGVAGVIKAVLSLQHREAFPLGNLQTPHPGIPFEELGVRLADAPITLAPAGEPFLVAINSFGYGGTNAHVVLRSAPQPANAAASATAANDAAAKVNAAPKRPDHLPLYLPLSARSPAALQALAQRYCDVLDAPATKLTDLLHSAALRRAPLSQRAVALGANREQLRAALHALVQGELSEQLVTGQQVVGARDLPVWVFSGMGPQWWAMGQQLYRDEPLYRAAVDEADAIFQRIAGFSILAEMLRSEADSQITKTIYAQPANFIVQWGIVAVLRAAGVTPGAVVGHSVGEVAAAAVSGALSLEDALRVSYERSRLQAQTAGSGSMLAVGVGRDALAPLLDAYAGRVEIAAANGPNTLTLSGETAAIEALAAELSAREIFNRVLNVEVPYHSYLMEPILDELTTSLRGIVAREPAIPVYSTVTGQRLQGPSFSADYWARNVREPVAFADAVQSLVDAGFATFVEVGPHPVLSSAMRDCVKARAKEIRLVETLRRNEAECKRVYRAIAQVFASGCTLDWRALNGAGRFTALPNYPWQRERAWLETERSVYQRVSPTERPLLGCEQYPATGVWVNDLEYDELAYLKDHIVSGTAIMPAAGYIETLLEMAALLHPRAPGWRIGDVEIRAPLVLAGDRAIDYVSSYDRDTRRAAIRSLDSGKIGEGQLHLTASVAALGAAEARRVDLAAWRAALPVEREPAGFYRQLARIGLQYGEKFQTVKALHLAPQGGRVLALIERDPALREAGYLAQPVMLDACFQVLVGLLEDNEATFLPTGFKELRLLVPQLPARYWCEAVQVRVSPQHIDADLTLVDDSGAVLAVIREMRVTASSAKVARTDDFGDPVKLQMVRYEWHDAGSASEPKRLGHWLVVEDPAAAALTDRLADGLEAFGARVCARLHAGAGFNVDGARISVRPDSADDIAKALAAAGPVSGVLFAHGAEAALDGVDPTATEALLFMLGVTRQLAALPVAQRPRTYLLTRNAFSVGDGDRANHIVVEPAQTALNGFARVAFNELEAMRFSTVDIPAAASDDDLDAAILELLCDADEDEVAIRRGHRFASRLEAKPWLAAPRIETVPLGSERAVQVRGVAEHEEQQSAGSVKLIETMRAPLASDALELRIEQIALTMRALRHSGADSLDQDFVEVVATVSAVGGDVTDLRVGQRVYGLAPADFASHIRGPRSAFQLVELPAAPGAAQTKAASALLFVALREAVAERVVEQADLAAGARVLIAADELGLAVGAALRRRGIETTLFASPADGSTRQPAGNVVAAIAATHAALETAVADVTADRGFDAIVAPMSAWADSFGWYALTAGGVLIDTAPRTQPFTVPPQAASIVRADLAVLTQRGGRFVAALRDAVERVGRGELTPVDSLAVSIVDLASRKLALPDADSPLIVSFDALDTPLQLRVHEALNFRADASYLVTGGLGGFGQKTARWLIEHGARHLVLAGRSGIDTPERRAFVAELEERGAHVAFIKCDLSKAGEVSDLFATLASSAAPLAGVFHSAAVIIDEPVAELDPRNLVAVMRSKAESARLLHEATRDMALDYFVLYSSIANLVGNSRQASYVAANGFLDGLAWHRRALGLPATSINWGAIADVGVVTRDEKLEQFMRYMGLRGMQSAEGLRWLERALLRETTQLGITLITNWSDWGRYETLAAQSPRFRELIAADTSADADPGAVLRAELAEVPAAERFTVLASLVAALIADELETSADAIPVDRPILDLGVDSLMATEIQSLLNRHLGIAVSVLEILDDLTVRAIVDKTLNAFGWGDADAAAPVAKVA
ncbi:SDR family NAD(P)-dependent oxidoreductase [Paraburkholderia sp. MMS20-SJTR3]|uniref:SDR family NAD(P)-dependent oxidoreductase n=1 Tax=Paraburkholderia sejongensis TaxID=2886946 RepID=A0ABS8JX43_9BURK|nr:type I polyketide synthase [Paraburkholderia sp. MMS20-SJTR3]MCC8394465.1 SDR family NAD(P)-dependent oxidoreductase [Paraburkholderia sp. MMS20-SJTR3]